MKSTLISNNYPKISKTIIIVPREKEILITTDDGIEIATLDICIMEKDEKVGESFEVKPSESFWLRFNPKSSQTHKAAADVYINE